MKNTTFLAALVCTLALTACGGGDSSSPTSGDLPSGKVGTVGDGMNASEFEAIQCGMNKDQVTAIVGDAPTIIAQDIGWIYKTSTLFSEIVFTSPNGVVKYKDTGPAGKPSIVTVKC